MSNTIENHRDAAAAIHRMATEIKAMYDNPANLRMHLPLGALLHLFAATATQIMDRALPTTTIESAKLCYLVTLLTQYSVDDIAAAYAATIPTTVAE